MSYKSPIEIISGNIQSQIENNVYSIVKSYGINVDKEELIKALEYDRSQYQKGYEDAKKGTKGEWKNVAFLTRECSECGAQFHELEYDNFCPNCGADMRTSHE